MKCVSCEKNFPLVEGTFIRNGMRQGAVKQWDFYCKDCDPKKAPHEGGQGCATSAGEDGQDYY